MNLQAVEKLEVQDGDIVILRATDVNSEELTKLFSELRRIKRASKKAIEFVVFSNDWAKLINV